jgi:hypothetical protein
MLVVVCGFSWGGGACCYSCKACPCSVVLLAVLLLCHPTCPVCVQSPRAAAAQCWGGVLLFLPLLCLLLAFALSCYSTHLSGLWPVTTCSSCTMLGWVLLQHGRAANTCFKSDTSLSPNVACFATNMRPTCLAYAL